MKRKVTKRKIDGMNNLSGETFAYHMQNVVDALNGIGRQMQQIVSIAAVAFIPIMHELETKYPEILNDDGSWRDDWTDIIRALPKRSDMLR